MTHDMLVEAWKKALQKPVDLSRVHLDSDAEVNYLITGINNWASEMDELYGDEDG